MNLRIKQCLIRQLDELFPAHPVAIFAPLINHETISTLGVQERTDSYVIIVGEADGTAQVTQRIYVNPSEYRRVSHG